MCCSCWKQHTFSRTEPGRSMVSTGKHHGDDDSSENVTSTGAFLLEEYIQSLFLLGSHGCAGHETACAGSAQNFPGVPGSKIRSSGCFLKWGSTKPWVSLLKWYEMAQVWMIYRVLPFREASKLFGTIQRTHVCVFRRADCEMMASWGHLCP